MNTFNLNLSIAFPQRNLFSSFGLPQDPYHRHLFLSPPFLDPTTVNLNLSIPHYTGEVQFRPNSKNPTLLLTPDFWGEPNYMKVPRPPQAKVSLSIKASKYEQQQDALAVCADLAERIARAAQAGSFRCWECGEYQLVVGMAAELRSGQNSCVCTNWMLCGNCSAILIPYKPHRIFTSKDFSYPFFVASVTGNESDAMELKIMLSKVATVVNTQCQFIQHTS